MPDEPPVPLMPARPRIHEKTRPSLLERFREIEKLEDLFKPLGDLAPEGLVPRQDHAPAPAKMYHPAGRFLDRAGSRFDYLFPELLEDPAPPLWSPVHLPVLLRGTGEIFYSRRMEREKDRLSVGLKYGHGDVPPHPAPAR